MRCLYCGHNTRGPWQFCDQTCQDDHDLESAAQEIDDAEPFDELDDRYTPCDEPADPLSIDA